MLIDWYCDCCDAYLNRQAGFTTETGCWVCANCGEENSVTEDDILSDEECELYEALHRECPECGGHMARGSYGNWWICEECGCEAEEDDYGNLVVEAEEDEMPECCSACGGPYPNCMTSCKIFDD